MAFLQTSEIKKEFEVIKLMEEAWGLHLITRSFISLALFFLFHLQSLTQVFFDDSIMLINVTTTLVLLVAVTIT